MALVKATLHVGAAACLAAAASAQAVTVDDAFGRRVAIASEPRRIVTVFSSNTELIAALGLSDRVVGIDAMTRYPPEILDRPHVGGRLGFSVDLVAAQQPDLVIVTPARQAANQLIEPMTRLGVPVIVLMARSMPEVLSNLRLLGKATGQTQRGEDVADALQSRLDGVAAAHGGKRRPRVVMITGTVGNGLLLVARAKTYTGDAVRLAGGELALPDLQVLPQVSPEAVLAAQPDVLLFAGEQQAFDALLAGPAWRDLPAVRNGNAHVVSRSEFLIPGPRTVDGIEKLAARLRSVTLP